MKKIPDQLVLGKAIAYARICMERHLLTEDVIGHYRQVVSAHGVTGDYVFFDLEQSTGDTAKGLQGLRGVLGSEPGCELYLYCFDDFAGDGRDKWEELLALCKTCNARIKLLEQAESFSVEGKGDVMIDKIRSVIAAKKAYISAKNSESGHQRRRLKKRPVAVPFPYLLEDDKPVLNTSIYRDTGKTYTEIARDIIELFFETESVSAVVADMCDLYGRERQGTRNHDFPRDPKALKGWLQNPFLRGTLVFYPRNPAKRMEYPGNHESIITESEYVRIRRILEHRKIVKKTDTLANPLAGLMHCAGCGSEMRVSQSKGGPNQPYRHYLVCKGAYPKVGHPRVCDRRSSYGLEIDTVISKTIGILSRMGDKVLDVVMGDEVDAPVPTAEMLAIKEKIEKLETIGIPEVQEVITHLRTEWERLHAEQFAFRKDRQDLMETTRLLVSGPNFWEFASPEELRSVFPAFIKDIVCDEGEVEIKLLP